MEQKINLPPTYKQMIEEMGKQLQLRKSLLFKRVLFITWPILLLIISGYGFQAVYDLETLPVEKQTWVIGVATVYIICSIIYSMIVGFIFEIEKRIWIDSFFDQKNLDSTTSWRIAKKLFWPGFKFRLQILWRYYLIPMGLATLIVGGIVVGVFKQATMSISQDNIIMVALVSFILLIIGLTIYSYYIKTKLRYAWFIFLDTFGVSYSFVNFVAEMEKLNTISKSETFKKSLIATVGTDSVRDLAGVAIGTLSFAMSHLGGAGKMLGQLASVYGNELSRQATDLGNITAQYLIYRFARKELVGSEQVVNEALYRL